MVRVQEYKPVKFTGFTKGLNAHADSSRIHDDELAQAMNMRLGYRGEVFLRTGYTRHDSNLVAGGSFLFTWRASSSAGNTDHIVVVTSDGQVWEDQLDGIFNDSGINTNPQGGLQAFGVGFAGAKDKTYLSAKDIVSTQSFDGTTWASVAGIPKAKHLIWRHNRLYAINDNANPSAVYASELGDPEDFTPGTAIFFDPDDGYEINAAIRFGDDLILFKDKSVHKLTGRDPSSFSAYRIDDHRGSVSHRTVEQLRGKLVFLDRDTGIWAFDGASFELISLAINDYVLEGMNYDLAYLASAYVAEDRYYISIPWGTGPIGTEYRTFVYYADQQGWTEYDTGFNAGVRYLDERYLGFPGQVGIWKADPASNIHPPDMSPIDGKLRTGWIRLGGPGSRARVRRIEMIIKSDPGVDFTVNLYREYNPDVIYATRNFVGGGVTFLPQAFEAEERLIAADGWGDRVNAVQIEIVVSETPFQLNELTLFYSGGFDVRGVR